MKTNNKKKNLNKKIRKYIKQDKAYEYKNNFLNNNNNLKNHFQKPIGLYDPYGENINPLTREPYKNLYSHLKMTLGFGNLVGTSVPKTYVNLAYNWTQLKVYQFITPLLNSIRENQVTLVLAGTGVGKTVLIPKVALHAFNFQKKVVCTVPKQKNASENATYSAQCLDVELGNQVGYYFMGDNKTSNKTMLTFTTSGSLKSKITGGDPYLNEYQCVIIDEIHERSVETDQLLLYMKEIMNKRPDFRLILMSATLNPIIFKNYFTVKSNFTYNEILIEGETNFDVKIYYEPKPVLDWKIAAVSRIQEILTNTNEGDILVFVKSGGDGNTLCEELKKKTRNIKGVNPFCVVYEAKSDKEKSEYAISPFAYKTHPDADPNNPYTRKVVMATNVVESSVTIDGIVYVIDNGYALEASFFPEENARSLLEERISQAAAKQRKGRAGRTQNGFCYRLYTEEEFKKFNEYPKPDIQKKDLTKDILDIFLLEYIKNVGDVRQFLNNMISPPEQKFIESGLNKIYSLGGITTIKDDGKVTDLGKSIAKFRVIEPNFAKAILASYYYHCKNDVLDIITITDKIDARMDGLFNKYRPRNRKMSNSDMKKEQAEFIKIQKSFYSPYGDYMTILNVYKQLKKYMELNADANPKTWCLKNGINSRVFVKNDSRGWDAIKNSTQRLNDILMKIVRPPELRNKYYSEYKNDGNSGTKAQNSVELITDSSADIFNDAEFSDFDSTNIVQEGGYEHRSYEINLFPDAVDMGSFDKNIMMSLSIGNITNLAKLINKGKVLYKTCFPMKKVFAKFDRNTTLMPKNITKLIMYHELFTMSKTQPTLKLNICTKIPADIIAEIKKKYKMNIPNCFEEEKEVFSPKKGVKKQSRGKFGQRKQKFIKKGK